MNMFKRSLLAALAAFLALPAFAQSVDDTPEDWVSPPRLAVAEGDVQLWRTSGDDWEDAPVNTALAQGDSLNVGADATVELQIGPRDFVRLPANSQITLAVHTPGMIHFQLSAGTASFDLRGNRSGQLVRIDADNANIVVAGRGYYRVSTREGETRIIVRNQGRATLTFVDGSSRSISSGQELVVRGRREAIVDVGGAPAQDAWDRWNDARSDYYAGSVSNRYVPADAYGAADLDQYGRWREDRTYGWVWAPGVAAGWAPYSSGSWRWDPVYGWTWVDTAPWGWTTSHYGRWVFIGGGWAWAPGPRTTQVRYAPALVAFFQGQGGISWMALGWGEPLIPWWGRPGFRGTVWWAGWGGPRRSFDRDRPVYRNHDARNAFIGMRDDEFGRRPVRGNGLQSRPGDARPIGNDHPVWRSPVRAPAGPAILPPGMRSNDARLTDPRRDQVPHVAPQQDRRPAPQFQPGPLNRPDARPDMQRERNPQPPAMVAPRPVEARPSVIVPVPARPAEAAPSLDRRDDGRERQRFDPRGETPAVPAPAQQTRPAAPAFQPRVMPREEPREQPRFQPREQPRSESREQPRMEMHRPQIQQPVPAQESRRGEDRRPPGPREGGFMRRDRDS